MIDPNETVMYDYRMVPIKDIPCLYTRKYFGMGHLSTGSRQVIPHPEGRPWRLTPDDCLMTDERNWMWVQDGTYLVCPGCGLDGT